MAVVLADFTRIARVSRFIVPLLLLFRPFLPYFSRPKMGNFRPSCPAMVLSCTHVGAAIFLNWLSKWYSIHTFTSGRSLILYGIEPPLGNRSFHIGSSTMALFNGLFVGVAVLHQLAVHSPDVASHWLTVEMTARLLGFFRPVFSAWLLQLLQLLQWRALLSVDPTSGLLFARPIRTLPVLPEVLPGPSCDPSN